ncbi:hypothetical protein R1flu_018929 [Riccia fluitans]|uniref:F-box domain-containing protein n=1 Tax=Riccia fluitans TaxID=41844 RepID=A0ABD1ZIS1_9MARC
MANFPSLSLGSLGQELAALTVCGDSCLRVRSREPSVEPEPGLDSDVWSRLPDSLVERIIARLPIIDLFRFRAVCKRWNAFMTNPGFLSSCANTPHVGPWFLLFTRGDYRNGLTHDQNTSKWHRIPLFAHLPPYESLYPCAAAKGLVCFISRFNALGTMTLVVCNPLTSSWRELPPIMEILPLYAVGILLDADQGIYHVVVSGLRRIPPTGSNPRETCRLGPTTEVFTSTSDCWRTTGGMPPGSYHSLAVPCNGSLYSWCYVSDALVAYNVASACWTQIYARLPRFFEGHRLVECDGQLFMVGGLNKDNITKGIYVLEFQWDNMEWIKVDRMPKLLCEQFLRYGTDFRCVGYSDLVLLYVVRYRRIRLAVLYDLAKKLWRRLPPCSLAEERLIHGIAFEPRLDAMA